MMKPASAPLQLDLACELGAPPEQVFTLLADHEALPTWVPGLRRVDVDSTRAARPGGAGAVRTLHPRIGVAGCELIIEVTPPHRLVYSASDASLRGLYTAHRAEITCTATGRGTRLTWQVWARPTERAWRRLFARLLVGFALWSSMRNLRRRFPLDSA
jgi:uncharacterized protein YndB with AHSA1/START domain